MIAKHKKLFLFTRLGCLILISGVIGACAKDPDPEAAASGPEVVKGHVVQQKEELSKTVVALIAQMPEGQALCTGTILSEDSILTAAHCVDNQPQPLTIIFSTDIRKTSPASTRTATAFVQHPQWSQQKKSATRGRGDLAIVHFEGGLPHGYQAVVLAPKEIELSPGTTVLMAGYGVTDGRSKTGSGVLRETETTVIDQASRTELITDGQQSSVCFGDSGGPAFAQLNDEYVQWGVASSVTTSACNEASVHTAVMSYLPWIKRTIKKLGDRGPSTRRQKQSGSKKSDRPESAL